MSCWCQLCISAHHRPRADQILKLLAVLEIRKAQYVDVYSEYEDQDDGGNTVAESIPCERLAAVCEVIDGSFRASLATYESGYIENANDELQRSGVEGFRFLSMSVEFGDHEVGGQSARQPAQVPGEWKRVQFSINIGGDDSRTQFREVAAALLDSNWLKSVLDRVNAVLHTAKAEVYFSS